MTRKDLVEHVKSKHSVSDTACFCTKCKGGFEDSLYRPEATRLTSRVKVRSDCFLKTFNACDLPSCKEKQTETNVKDFITCFHLDEENIIDVPLCQQHYSHLNYFENKLCCDVCTSTINKEKYLRGKDFCKIQCFLVISFKLSI